MNTAMAINNRDILKRIDARLDALGKTSRAASLEAGMGPDAIRNLRRDPTVMPRLDTLEDLAFVLETTPEWLAYAVYPAGQAPAADLPILGEVAAGRWLDVSDSVDQTGFPPIEGGANPKWPTAAQYGLIVRGTSLNKRANEGDILHCLSTDKARLIPKEGEVVIVERRRAQGSLIELTAKVLKRRMGVNELWPDSDDPRWSEPIVLTRSENADTDSVEITAVVDRIIRPLRRE